MPLIPADYIRLQQKVIKEQDKFSAAYKANQEGEYALNEQIQKSTAPIVAELQKIDAHKKESVSPIKFEVKPKLPLSLIPKYKKGTIPGSDGVFDLIEISDKKLILTKQEDGKQYVSLLRKDTTTYELTPELQEIMEGYGGENSSHEAIKDYLDIVGKKNINYIKTLEKILEPKKEGSGLPKTSFLVDNPVSLFIQLRKLLAAKQAGNNNVDNEVNAICMRLVETKYLSPEKYKKIINIYFPK